MFTKQFWLDTFERAIKTAAQFGIFAWGTTAFTSVGDVVPVAEATALAMGFGLVLSTLTSIASIGIGEKGTPNLVAPIKPPAAE